jgi:N-methylhydantoinase A
MAWQIGVDIGGTFTDVALVDDVTGRIGVAKVRAPGDLSQGCLPASGRPCVVTRCRPRGPLLSHTTTVVTNAILEERGARAALITTRGFRDVLELRRSARGNLYDLFRITGR